MMDDLQEVVDRQLGDLRNERDRCVQLLKRWQKWKKGETVDCSLDHDTAKLIRRIEEGK